jgi:hypothetical protein
MTYPGFLLERDLQRGRIVITLSTRATVDAWKTTVAALVAANGWRDPLIYDMSAVESTSLLLNLPNLVPIVADLIQAHGRQAAVAVIVSYRELEVWRQRLSGLFDHLVTVEAFSDLAVAHSWLDSLHRPRA